MAKCSQCNQEISCSTHEHAVPLDKPIAPCETSSIWVRAVDEDSGGVAGMDAKIGAIGRKDATVGNGFAKLEDLPEGKHTVEFELDQDARKRYVPPDPAFRKETLRKGELKLLVVRLRARVAPRIELSSRAAALGGKLTLTLATDLPYTGKGALRCTAGADKIACVPSLADGPIELAAGDTVEVQARSVSTMDEIVFEWTLPPDWQRGEPGRATMTAVKASLAPITEADTAAPRDGAGLLVHVQDPDAPRRRSKVRVEIEPREYEGHVRLGLRRDNLTLHDALADGNAIDHAKPFAVGPDLANEVFVEGTAASEHQGDSGLELRFEAQPELADECVATVLRATLDVHRQSGLVPADEKNTVGVVVQLKEGATPRRRAKLVVAVEPADYRGEVSLTRTGPASFTLWNAPADGEMVPANAIEVTDDIGEQLYLQGTVRSNAASDTTLALRFVGLADAVDAIKATVVKIRLVSYAARVGSRKDDPLELAEDKKLAVGRVLALQTGKLVPRAKLRVEKLPIDAPCAVTISHTNATGNIRLFPNVQRVGAHDNTFENVRDNETPALGLPRVLAPSAFTVPEGLVFWVDGVTATAERAVSLQLDVEEVDVACDAVAYTVRNPSLRIQVARTDGNDLVDEVQVDITAQDAAGQAFTGPIPADTGVIDVAVPAGHYIIKLRPQDPGEAEMRVNRLAPTIKDAAIAVIDDGAVASFELAPGYTDAQFIGLWMQTGQSKGIDVLKPTLGEKIAEATADMQGKCAILKNAIRRAEAKIGGDIDDTPTTLKVFMAPEFYFRGAQGAYPFEVVPKILKEMKDVVADDAFDDWLFVLGTAVAVISPPAPIVDPTKKAEGTITRAVVISGEVRAVMGMQSTNLERVNVTTTYVDAVRPAWGWVMIAPRIGSVVGVLPNGSVMVDCNVAQGQNYGAWVGQTATFVDPCEVEIVNVAIVRKGGKKLPTGADGRMLRELLIEKEYVSWNDMPSPIDDGQGKFFSDRRQIITIFGETCRAKAPEGSYMATMFGWPVKPPTNRSEVNTSGMGGGSVFTIDGVAFGLEVCMDHGLGSRLQRYYAGADPTGPRTRTGEPFPQIQLIPSGGMSINQGNVVTVADGLVFNVDKDHTDAQFAHPFGAIPKNALDEQLTLDASAHFETTWAPGDGVLHVYDVAPIPAPEWVA